MQSTALEKKKLMEENNNLQNLVVKKNKEIEQLKIQLHLGDQTHKREIAALEADLA